MFFTEKSENKLQLIADFRKALKDQYKAQRLFELMGLAVTIDLGRNPRDLVDRLLITEPRGSDPDTMPTEIRDQVVRLKKEAIHELRDSLKTGLDNLDRDIKNLG